MRQPEQSGGKRAAIASFGAHALLLVALLIAGPGQGPPPAAPSIIEAELLTAIPAPADDADEPLPATSAAPPPPNESEVKPIAAAAPAPPPEPLARVAEAAAPTLEAPDPAVEPEQAPAEQSPTELVASDVPETPAEPASIPADTSAEAADDAIAAPSAAPPLRPGKRIANAEQAMLTKRLASWTGQFTADEPNPTLRWRENGQHYTAVLRRQPATDSMGMDHLTVEVTTERDGNRMLTELRMTRVAFSNFAQFVDRWNPEVSIHDDEIDGRFHSNSPIHVSGGPGVRPVFRGKVTLAARDVETDTTPFGTAGFVNRRAMFPAGLETMVRRISLAPGQPPTTAEDNVQRFERDTAITFYEDGSYGWRDIGPGSTAEQIHVLTDKPHYLTGASQDVTLEVHGTVKGTVLVYTPGKIVIVRHLRYAHDPREAGAADYLGLVAERSVEIANPEVTGPGDLEVYASIYARGLFAVRSYLSRRAGRLLIYGSLAAGSLTATEPRYATSVHFDQRLATMRAPGFPLSDRYELESASGEWRKAPDPTE